MKKVLSTFVLAVMAMATYAAGYGETYSLMYSILVCVCAIIAFAAAIGLYVLVAVMAKNRNRNVALWVLLSLVGSPILIAIILLIVGNSDKNEFRNLE